MNYHASARDTLYTQPDELFRPHPSDATLDAEALAAYSMLKQQQQIAETQHFDDGESQWSPQYQQYYQQQHYYQHQQQYYEPQQAQAAPPVQQSQPLSQQPAQQQAAQQGRSSRQPLKVAPVRGSSHPASIFNLPPKKVVRANSSYTARFAGELSFEKGDFFYVINERPDGASYEVINPIQRLRGVVPVACFDNLDKVQSDAQRRIADEQQQGSAEYNAAAPVSAPEGNNYTMTPPILSPQPATAALSSSGSRTIQSALVQRAEHRNDGQWWFTVEIKRSDGSTNILFRVYDDFWILQVSLLNFFPAESGRESQPRSIPFLAPPTRTMTPEQAHARRQALETYLLQLIKLPHRIMNSQAITRFFTLRQGDLDTPLNIRFDVSETLMDLLNDYGEDSDLDVKVNLGDEVIEWKEPDYVSYNDLCVHAQQKLGFRFQFLMYKDECEQFIPLRGESDLELLVTTNSRKLVFYVS